MQPMGITRVRNEALIIEDTIKHFLAYCDSIILYDDCSTDDTVGIAQETGKDRVYIVRGDRWRKDRHGEETRHRARAWKAALSVGAEWCLCFDADERLVGDLPPLEGNGYTFRLFDGYITPEFANVTYAAGPLQYLPRMWGPEYRDILMLFRTSAASWPQPGLRQPALQGTRQRSDVLVKHYGKCMSVEQWEEACDYYMSGFPPSFKNRWKDRKGKAIHTLSDFGRPLYTWDDLMEIPQAWRKL